MKSVERNLVLVALILALGSTANGHHSFAAASGPAIPTQKFSPMNVIGTHFFDKRITRICSKCTSSAPDGGSDVYNA